MGLDMYLYAERTFDPKDLVTKAMITAADASLDELVIRASLEPNTPPHWEEDKYLSGWEHSGPGAAKVYADTLRSAGLSNLRTDDSPSIHIGFRPDDREQFWKGKVYVRSVAIYWRKANAIHAWFVDNVQDGVDECQTAPVTREDLETLRDRCTDALNAYRSGNIDSATEILEPRSGFFFGTTNLDEWWEQDTERTINEINRVLIEADRIGGVTFAYHSSW